MTNWLDLREFAYYSLHEKLKRVADRKGLTTSALIRMWLIERLEQDVEGREAEEGGTVDRRK